MSTEALLALLAQRKAAVSRVKTEKPPVGRSRWRLLPSWRGAGDPQFWMDFGQHFIKDAAGQIKAVFVCNEKTFGKPCQVCEAISHGLGVADEMTKKRLSDAKSNGRVLFNALRIDGPNPTVPVILEVAPTVFNGNKGVGGIISLFEQWPTLLDPAAGHDIIIEKVGSGIETRYGVQIAGGSQPVPPSALTQLHDLDKFVSQESEEAERRALASVAAITGLPAPSVAPALGMSPAAVDGYGRPVSADMPSTGVVDMYATMPAPTTAAAPVVYAAPTTAAAPAVAVATPAVAPAPAAAPAVAAAAPAPAAVTTAPPVASTGDAELDRLLSDLGPT